MDPIAHGVPGPFIEMRHINPPGAGSSRRREVDTHENMTIANDRSDSIRQRWKADQLDFEYVDEIFSISHE